MKKDIMHKYVPILTLLFFAGLFHIKAQDFSAELQKLIRIPNSPEAEAFQRYGNTSVSLYTGTPNVQVPIYVIEGREMSIPLSLTYDASGVKVEQLATNVGLGWNLNIGGRISRMVNGAPDDCFYTDPSYDGIFDQTVRDKINLYSTTSTSVFDTHQDAKDYLEFVKDATTGKIDTQPDYFSLNVGGLNDKIVFRTDAVPFAASTLKNPRIKVEWTTTTNGNFTYVDTWKITDEDGTIYHFEVAETTNMEDGYVPDPGSGIEFYGVFKEYNSSWLLTKVESPNRKDVFEFEYIDMGEWNQDVLGAAVSKNTFSANDGNSVANTYTYNCCGSTSTRAPAYRLRQFALHKVRYNGNLVLDVVLGNREDYFIDNAIDEINLYSINDSTAVLRNMKFNHSYFGNAASSDKLEKRLKLDSVEFRTSNDSAVKKYLMEYFSPSSVPSRNSLSQDYLGFNNGKNNPVLYPTVQVGNDTYNAANRDPDLSFAKIGSLSKIVYPTGGSTQFEYELHKLTETSNVSGYTTFGEATVNGGLGNSADCGFCCQDTFITAPKITYVDMNITTAGSYLLDFSKTGGVAQGILIKRGGTSIIPYTSIINQASCLPDYQITWSGFNSTSTTVELVPGNYQLTVLNNSSGQSATLKIRKYLTQPVTSTVPKAGLRIKSITDYTDANVFAMKKEYKYTKTSTSSESSAKEISIPTLVYYNNYQINNNGQSGTVTNVNRLSYNANGSESPHIAYEKVYEYRRTSSGASEGYIEHKFFTGSSGVQTIVKSPFPNYYLVDEKAGNIDENIVYDDGDNIAEKQKFEYYHFDTFNARSFYSVEKPDAQFSYAMIYPIGNGKYSYTYEPATMQCLNCLSCPSFDTSDCTPIPQEPSPCNDPNNDCLPGVGKYSFQLNLNGAQGTVARTIKQETTRYFDGQAVEEVVEYDYNQPTIDYLLRERMSSTSKSGVKLSEKYHYPKDLLNTGVYTQMVNANRLNDIVKTETSEIDGQTTLALANKEIEFSAVGAGFQPKFLKLGKGSNSAEKRLKYIFDTSGNLVANAKYNGESSPVDYNIYTSYLWGYQNTLPIAKIENLDYNAISQATITSLKTLSNADKDSSSETALRNALNSLRTTHPDALITTYTHNPGIGVTSMTDPRGYTIYYTYDTFNRVKEVRDADNNLVTDYEYHYKTQQ